MTWVKLDDQIADHPKYVELGDLAPLALALQVRALCYANRFLTDGYVPATVLPQLTVGFASLTAEPTDWPALMVKAGLWEKNGKGGYQIHDYTEYQPTSDKVTTARAQRREAGLARAQVAQRVAGRFAGNRAQTGETTDQRDHQRAAGPLVPAPARPVPKDKDSALTRENNGPVPIREVLHGKRMRLDATPPKPEDGQPS